jgi:hypothetical protein
VDPARPTLRFFTRSTSTFLPSLLKVDVLFQTPGGRVLTLPIGLVTQSSGWTPSPSFAIVVSLISQRPDGLSPVQFRFTPIGSATWSLDDVYLDPKSRS